MGLHNREEPNLCEYCDNAFSNKSYLSDHMEMHRYSNLANYRLYTEEEPRPCTRCNKDSIGIANDNDFARHNKMHFGENPCQK